MKTLTLACAFCSAIVLVAVMATTVGAAPSAQTSAATPVAPYEACAGAPQSRLVIGSVTMVSANPPLPNIVRREPNRISDRLGQVQPGEVVTVIDGPACSDGYVWWKVQSPKITGWTIEGDSASYWLVPPSTSTPTRTPSPTRTPHTPTATPNATGTRQAIDRLSTATVEAGRANATQAMVSAAGTRTALLVNQTATRVAAPTRTAEARAQRTATQRAQATARLANATATVAQATLVADRRSATAVAARLTATVAAQATFARATQLAGCRPVQWSSWRDSEKISYRGYIFALGPDFVIIYASSTDRLVFVSLLNTTGLESIAPNVAITVCGMAGVGDYAVVNEATRPFAQQGRQWHYIIGEFWSK